MEVNLGIANLIGLALIVLGAGAMVMSASACSSTAG
jgi:hypothetical protein